MSIGMILLIALSLTGSAAVAAVLDVRRRARRL